MFHGHLIPVRDRLAGDAKGSGHGIDIAIVPENLFKYGSAIAFHVEDYG